MNQVYHSIQTTIRSFLPECRILLFGSRARGDYQKHSDYDLLIITPANFTQREKMNWRTKIHHAIIKEIHAPVDLLMCSEEELVVKQELPGHIMRTVIREGVAL